MPIYMFAGEKKKYPHHRHVGVTVLFREGGENAYSKNCFSDSEENQRGKKGRHAVRRGERKPKEEEKRESGGKTGRKKREATMMCFEGEGQGKRAANGLSKSITSLKKGEREDDWILPKKKANGKGKRGPCPWEGNLINRDGPRGSWEEVYDRGPRTRGEENIKKKKDLVSHMFRRRERQSSTLSKKEKRAHKKKRKKVASTRQKSWVSLADKKKKGHESGRRGTTPEEEKRKNSIPAAPQKKKRRSPERAGRGTFALPAGKRTKNGKTTRKRRGRGASPVACVFEKTRGIWKKSRAVSKKRERKGTKLAGFKIRAGKKGIQSRKKGNVGVQSEVGKRGRLPVRNEKPT